eukprot:IDg10973t1
MRGKLLRNKELLILWIERMGPEIHASKCNSALGEAARPCECCLSGGLLSLHGRFRSQDSRIQYKKCLQRGRKRIALFNYSVANVPVPKRKLS